MKQVIELLGKTVKFVHTENGHFFEEQGKITDVILNIQGKHHITLESKECFLLESLLEFKILENDLVGDALEGLITDNKEFIDSLSKPCYTSIT